MVPSLFLLMQTFSSVLFFFVCVFCFTLEFSVFVSFQEDFLFVVLSLETLKRNLLPFLLLLKLTVNSCL